MDPVVPQRRPGRRRLRGARAHRVARRGDGARRSGRRAPHRHRRPLRGDPPARAHRARPAWHRPGPAAHRRRPAALAGARPARWPGQRLGRGHADRRAAGAGHCLPARRHRVARHPHGAVRRRGLHPRPAGPPAARSHRAVVPDAEPGRPGRGRQRPAGVPRRAGACPGRGARCERPDVPARRRPRRRAGAARGRAPAAAAADRPADPGPSPRWSTGCAASCWTRRPRMPG